MVNKPPTAPQLRKVRLRLERADAEIQRLGAIPDQEHIGHPIARRTVLEDVSPDCPVCCDLQRWIKIRNELSMLDRHIQAAIAQKALAAAEKRGTAGDAHRNRAQATRQRILEAARKVGSSPSAIIEHMQKHGGPVHDEKTIRRYLKEADET